MIYDLSFEYPPGHSHVFQLRNLPELWFVLALWFACFMTLNLSLYQILSQFPCDQHALNLLQLFLCMLSCDMEYQRSMFCQYSFCDSCKVFFCNPYNFYKKGYFSASCQSWFYSIIRPPLHNEGLSFFDTDEFCMHNFSFKIGCMFLIIATLLCIIFFWVEGIRIT